MRQAYRSDYLSWGGGDQMPENWISDWGKVEGGISVKQWGPPVLIWAYERIVNQNFGFYWDKVLQFV